MGPQWTMSSEASTLPLTCVGLHNHLACIAASGLAPENQGKKKNIWWFLTSLILSEWSLISGYSFRVYLIFMHTHCRWPSPSNLGISDAGSAMLRIVDKKGTCWKRMEKHQIIFVTKFPPYDHDYHQNHQQHSCSRSHFLIMPAHLPWTALPHDCEGAPHRQSIPEALLGDCHNRANSQSKALNTRYDQSKRRILKSPRISS